jgi:hypothetical protein
MRKQEFFIIILMTKCNCTFVKANFLTAKKNILLNTERNYGNPALHQRAVVSLSMLVVIQSLSSKRDKKYFNFRKRSNE